MLKVLMILLGITISMFCYIQYIVCKLKKNLEELGEDNLHLEQRVGSLEYKNLKSNEGGDNLAKVKSKRKS